MLFKIVEWPTQPGESDETKHLWSGGHISNEERALSAAALVSIFPALEVGSWIKFEDFKTQIEAPPPDDPHPIWTTIEIGQNGVAGLSHATIEVEQNFAVRSICKEVSRHIEQLYDISNVWIRFE